MSPRTHMAHSAWKQAYFFLAEDGKVEHNFERVGVGSDDDELSDAAVEGFGGLVGSLFDLLQRRALRHQIVDF